MGSWRPPGPAGECWLRPGGAAVCCRCGRRRSATGGATRTPRTLPASGREPARGQPSVLCPPPSDCAPYHSPVGWLDDAQCVRHSPRGGHCASGVQRDPDGEGLHVLLGVPPSGPAIDTATAVEVRVTRGRLGCATRRFLSVYASAPLPRAVLSRLLSSRRQPSRANCRDSTPFGRALGRVLVPRVKARPTSKP